MEISRTRRPLRHALDQNHNDALKRHPLQQLDGGSRLSRAVVGAVVHLAPDEVLGTVDWPHGYRPLCPACTMPKTPVTAT